MFLKMDSFLCVYSRSMVIKNLTAKLREVVHHLENNNNKSTAGTQKKRDKRVSTRYQA